MQDLISRQAAIDAICRDGVRLERGGALMITISTAKQWAVDLLGKLPAVQPEIIRCRNCKFASGDSRICMKFGHSPIGELDFCAWAERRTDG